MKSKAVFLFGSMFTMLSLCGLFFVCNSCSSMSGMPKSVLLTKDIENEEYPYQTDSITIIATKRYKAGLIKPIFQGSNYRKAWQTPIRVPLLDLSTFDGGLKPLEKGGGLQTLSMDLQGPDGIVYTLRSINKNPEEAVPEGAKKWKVEDIVYDAMSAQHPYGALVVRELSNAANLLHTNPQLFYVPSQPGLDSFDNEFKDQLFLLEYEPEGTGSWIDLPNVQKIIDTEDIQEIMFKDTTARCDKRALIRCRLFDVLIGDWDRHAKQWGWIEQNIDGKKFYTPLPTDRDNAFYNPGGLIPWIVTRPGVTPFLRPFRKKVDHMPGMITAFDQYFLLDVPEEVYLEEARKLDADLTEEEIRKSFEVWPQAFYDIDAKEMIKKMLARKKNIEEYALQLKKAIDDRGPITEPMKGSSQFWAGKAPD